MDELNTFFLLNLRSFAACFSFQLSNYVSKFNENGVKTPLFFLLNQHCQSPSNKKIVHLCCDMLYTKKIEEST